VNKNLTKINLFCKTYQAKLMEWMQFDFFTDHLFIENAGQRTFVEFFKKYRF